MHFPNKTVNEASIVDPGSLKENCLGSHFPQKSPENDILKSNH